MPIDGKYSKFIKRNNINMKPSSDKANTAVSEEAKCFEISQNMGKDGC